MNPDTLLQVVNNLKIRISSLEDQYRGFVKYCIDMIKNHRLLIDCELKNDPNTPRELLKQITLHGEHLENSVKLASSSITLQNPTKISVFETFKYEILFLIKEPSSDSHKSSRIETLISNLENFISSNYTQKQESPFESFFKGKTQNTKLNKLQNEEITRLNSTILTQNQKISNLERALKAKDEKFQQVYRKLDKIQRQQAINTKNINSHCSSFQYNRILSPDLKGYDSMMTHDMNLSSQSFAKPEESFESKSFYIVVKRKLLILSEIVKKFVGQVCVLDQIIGQNPEFDSFLHTFRADTEEIGKVIEDIVTPRFREEALDRRREVNHCLTKIRKLKDEKENLKREGKMKDLKIEQMKSLNENLSCELKVVKGKLVANVKVIDTLQFKVQEIGLENKRIVDQMALHVSKENENFLKVNRFSSVISEKSAENYSVRIEKNLEITTCCNISIKNVYKNENLIRELRKMLKLKEKECLDKDSLISSFEKDPKKSSNFLDIDKNEKPEFTSIKNKFSYEENSALSKKLSIALMEKAKIEEKFQDNERFVARLQEKNKFLSSEIEILKLRIVENKGNKGKNDKGVELVTVNCFKFHILPNREVVGEVVEKLARDKNLKLVDEVREISLELNLALGRAQRAERELKENEAVVGILNGKLEIYEKENEKLSKLLKTFQENSPTQQTIINSLHKEKNSLSLKLEQLTSSLHSSETKIKFLTQFTNSNKNQIETSFNIHQTSIEKQIRKLEYQEKLQSSKLSRLLKLVQSLSIKFQISRQSQSSEIKSLTMRIQDKENSILTLTQSLKLAESTILNQNIKILDLEKEKDSLLATRTSLLTQLAILNEQLKQKPETSCNKPDPISSSIEKFSEIIKNSETSKKSLKITIKQNEILINSLKSQINSLKSDLQQLHNSHQTLTQEKDSNLKQIESLQIKIRSLEAKIQTFASKSTEDEAGQIKSVLQSQIIILDSDYKKLEEKLKTTENSKNKEIEKLNKNLENLAKQLASSNMKNEELKSKIIEEDWKNKDFIIVKSCKFQDKTWFLVELTSDGKLMWTDQNLGTGVKSEEEEIKAKYIKVKNYCFKLRQEFKRLNKKIQVWRKETEFEKEFNENQVNQNLFDLTSPFISPRDPELQQIYDGLKSARSNGTGFDEDTFGELSSIILNEGNSIFNASSIEEINEDADKINFYIEKMNGDLQVKNEVFNCEINEKND